MTATGDTSEPAAMTERAANVRGTATCVLLRHAERPPIAAGELGSELALTSVGVDASLRFGEKMRGPLAAIHTSPVKRCMQTATLIRRGARSHAPIRADALLGDPGVYIRDPELAWGNWLHLGHEGVLASLATGEAILPGFNDIPGATRRLLEHLLERASASVDGSLLAVTHDAVMIPLFAAVMRRGLEPSEYPDYLEAVVLTRDDGSVRISYRGRLYSAQHLLRTEV